MRPATTFTYKYTARVTVYAGPRGRRRILEVVNVEGTIENARGYDDGYKKASAKAKRDAEQFAGRLATHSRIDAFEIN